MGVRFLRRGGCGSATSKVALVAAWTLVATMLIAPAALAAPINHGTFLGSNVQYVDVTEDSVTDTPPLFGAPTIAGDTLDFSPVSFSSTSSGAGGVDQTDGTLSMMVSSLGGSVIPGIKVSTGGDFTLTGLGGAGTSAGDSLSVFVNIIEVDGAGINPVNLNSAVSNGWDLAANGPGPFVSGPWSGAVTFGDLNAVLTANNVPYTNGVTKLTVTLDNTLTTTSEAGTASLINKKDFQIEIVPEPSTAALAAGALTAAILLRRRRRD